MADPAATSIVIPAFNEATSIASVVGDLRSAGSWHEILVVDDGSTDETSARASVGGARVIRHPYNKGNGAAVKTGIRHATGAYVLIVDADGQHRPSDAVRPRAPLYHHHLVGRAPWDERHAECRGGLGEPVLEMDARLPNQQPHPGLP